MDTRMIDNCKMKGEELRKPQEERQNLCKELVPEPSIQYKRQLSP
jgi:hypothetical protein